MQSKIKPSPNQIELSIGKLRHFRKLETLFWVQTLQIGGP